MADQHAMLPVQIQRASGIGVNQDDILFKGSRCAERVNERNLSIGVVQPANARVLEAPVAGAEHDLRAFRDHRAEEFRESQVPADSQSDLAKARRTDNRVLPWINIAALRKPEIHLAVAPQNLA